MRPTSSAQLQLLAVAVLLAVNCADTRAADAAATAEPPYRRGVNLAGPEFGDVPGKLHFTYTYNDEASFRYFAEKGFTALRVPIRWERIQPALKGPLDSDNLRELKQNIAWAKKYGATVIIDVHNYARYDVTVDGKHVGAIIDGDIGGKVYVTTADFCDLWTKLSAEFKDEPGVYAYGLMNEPNNMGKSDWKAISSAAVKAIRAAKDSKWILVGGDFWSNANNWESINGPKAWADDPENRCIYEAHCYFDHDNSGVYAKSYADELAANPKLDDVGRDRVAGFIAWCARNKVKGFIGEFACPRTDARWNTVLDRFLSALDDANIGGTYWAAGTFWGDGYPMSIHPADNMKTDRPQLAVMLKHLEKK